MTRHSPKVQSLGCTFVLCYRLYNYSHHPLRRTLHRSELYSSSLNHSSILQSFPAGTASDLSCRVRDSVHNGVRKERKSILFHHIHQNATHSSPSSGWQVRGDTVAAGLNVKCGARLRYKIFYLPFIISFSLRLTCRAAPSGPARINNRLWHYSKSICL